METIFMGKSNISMAMFNSYVCVPEGSSICPLNLNLAQAFAMFDYPQYLPVCESDPGQNGL